ncbi:MAG: 4-hydroxy-tetrahydrodipicolinate synthase [Candidatus Hinthialibacter antarcticus]|nr:4-hydroxy-tetrahydrodipicolinate synthase [Candidatus Hinthialibacter antarcticus]
MFEGSAVALVTPFSGDSIDYTALEKLIDFHANAGTECILVCGTTGESATLTHNEHKELIKHSAAYIRSIRGTNSYPILMAGTGSNSTKEALELTQGAKDANADCALLISPYYNKPTQKGLLEHFRVIAREVDIPQVLYNIQGRTAINIETDTMVALSDEKNIIGVKEASGNLGQVSEVIRRTPDNFFVWSGDDGLTLPILSLGGNGVISVSANIVPKDVRALVQAFLKGDHAEALRIHQHFAVLNSTMFVETNPIPVKTAVNLMSSQSDSGLPHCGDFRLPLVPLEPNNMERLKTVLQQYGLLAA